MKIIGHRGAKSLAPENTLAAIDKALEHGVDEIEIDVRITSDGVAVVHHDTTLTDQAGDRLLISKTPLATLVEHKADLPTLEAAIRHLRRRVPLQVEVKGGEPTKPIITLLRKLLNEGWESTDFLIGSKKQATLLALHRALPTIPVVVIEPFLSVRGVLRARQVDTKRLSMNQLGLWSGFVRSMQRRGYELYAYTLNTPRKAERWAAYGLTGVITDNPEVFTALRDRPDARHRQ